jgi:hypothetical protein
MFTVNCIDSKSAVRVLAVVGVIILVTQAGMTVARYETGYLTPFSFGDTQKRERMGRVADRALLGCEPLR